MVMVDGNTYIVRKLYHCNQLFLFKPDQSVGRLKCVQNNKGAISHNIKIMTLQLPYEQTYLDYHLLYSMYLACTAQKVRIHERQSSGK